MSKPKGGKKQISNILFIIFIALLLIPQTRRPIQVALNSIKVAIFSPSIIDDSEVEKLLTYNWELQNENGLKINFEDYKGEVVLINFWATWCPPCIAEMPSLDELYKDYNGKVKFLFVTNEDIATVQKFKKKKDFQFKMHSSLSSIPAQFETSSIPRTFILSKTGKIVVDETGAADWNSDRTRELLNRLLSE
ncbi:MAG: thiol-disulfide oxidoreductase [Bacteroidetes bacterium MedPE-SWsnd-G2]|nr:MAG: thiol-disulfide oxidoreductase [Bacteroidetes bacterium MedPE-SWsnd-G2]